MRRRKGVGDYEDHDCDGDDDYGDYEDYDCDDDYDANYEDVADAGGKSDWFSHNFLAR